jgi:hypothetical protein
MLDYIIRKPDNKIYVASDNQYAVYDMTFQKYINNILMKRLTNLEALEKCSKKYFSLKSKIPLILSKDKLMLCIISYRMLNLIYINYLSISKYEREKNLITVYFNSGHCLKIENVYAFLNQYKLARKIIDKISALDF